MKATNLKTRLLNLIAQEKTAQVIQELIRITKRLPSKDLYNEVIMQSAKYRKYKKEKMRGTLGNEPLSILISNIEAALVEIVNQLPDKPGKVIIPSRANLEVNIFLRIAIFFILITALAFLFHFYIDSPKEDPAMVATIEPDSTEQKVKDIPKEEKNSTLNLSSKENIGDQNITKTNGPTIPDPRDSVIEPPTITVPDNKEPPPCPCPVPVDAKQITLIAQKPDMDYKITVDCRNGKFNWCYKKEWGALFTVKLWGNKNQLIFQELRMPVGPSSRCPKFKPEHLYK